MAWNNVQRKRTYQCWQDMKQRCLNPRNHNFPRYGARGIAVCARWLASFANFVEDMGEKPDGLTLDRIDNDGNYEPGNCRWAGIAEQRINRADIHTLTLNGETKPLRYWAKDFGLSEATLLLRVRKLGSLEAAVASPINPVKQRAGQRGGQARWGAAIAAAAGDAGGDHG